MKNNNVQDKVKKQYQDLDEMLGSNDSLDVFTDGKTREFKPIPLKDFSEFMSNIAIINSEALWTNFLQDESAQAVTKILSMSIDEKEDEIMKVVNAKNYPAIINKILEINGIELSSKENDEIDSKKKE
ncbi:hypothetical protein [Abyssisolibacter fermentans]|uniref:hypothetical protein n=1 Tax=Abyssisolibacter fermentans TaxID=1766203 RepID=UPI000832EBC6|nr:hypothetical protein [Abyssisolibacter fermentans]